MENLLIDLKKIGLDNIGEIYRNASYDKLNKDELLDTLQGYEKGHKTDFGAVAVDTGIFTGRSPNDKYIVDEESSRKNIWWKNEIRKSSDNKPISQEVWNDLKSIAVKQLNSDKKNLYVMDCFVGANEDTRLSIRFVMEVAWQAHFVKNMFIRPSEEDLKNFKADFVVLNASKTTNKKWKEHKLNSDVFAAFHLAEKMAVIGGTWYGGEMKKGIFSVMNYMLPLKNIAAMHCSANLGKKGDTAIFFGLSGTGKTTLSADPNRALIGDDEHGWDNNGVFNFEGGCYAKTIDLDFEKEPGIYKAIKKDALLENIAVKDEKVDFADVSKTKNTRVSYPIYHLDNIVKPVSKGGHPKNVIFLTADAFGVLPLVSKLTKDQTKYHFLNGYTAKIAGTERGIIEPVPSFSACFGAAFLLLHPTVYSQELVRKMEEHNSNAYLVNTGWIGGSYGVGKRIDLPSTRKIIDAILDGSIDNADFEKLDIFNLNIPKHVNGVDSNLLNPRNLWEDKEKYDETAKKLAKKFIENFKSFTDNEEGKRLVAAGPQL